MICRGVPIANKLKVIHKVVENKNSEAAREVMWGLAFKAHVVNLKNQLTNRFVLGGCYLSEGVPKFRLHGN